MLLDVVYNHFGPDGNYLHLYAPQFFTDRHHTPWGAAINFDGDARRGRCAISSCTTRSTGSRNFTLDGLRLDAVHAIADDSSAAHTGRARRRDPQRAGARPPRAPRARERQQPGALPAARGRRRRAALRRPMERRRAPCFPRHADRRIRRLLRRLRRRADAAPRTLPGGGLRLPGRALAASRRRAARGTERDTCHPPRSFPSSRRTTRSATGRSANVWRRLPKSRRCARPRSHGCSPRPRPCLFMGEEFGAATPFLYFCDFDGRACRGGPRRPAARVRANSRVLPMPRARAAIPDPNDPDTFARSKLDWASQSARRTRAGLRSTGGCSRCAGNGSRRGSPA